jgi:hypothetical protein
MLSAYGRLLIAVVKLGAFLTVLVLGLHSIRAAGLLGQRVGTLVFNALGEQHLLADNWRETLEACGGVVGLVAGCTVVGWAWWRLAGLMRRPNTRRVRPLAVSDTTSPM